MAAAGVIIESLPTLDRHVSFYYTKEAGSASKLLAEVEARP